MAALPDWASPWSNRPANSDANRGPSVEFAREVYRETKGATPELRALVREYKAKKANGAIRSSSTVGSTPKR